jgi:ubiquinone/menaquinone biosynthesis C-methylase UbiE
VEKEKHWSRMAGDFEKRVNYVAGKRNIEAIQKVLAAQDLSGKVIELGCGNGTYSTVLASKADRLYATDHSDQMVSVCKVRLKHLKNAVVEKQNCFALSYPDAGFDAVVMINLLHVIPEPEKAVRESRRVLKTNGKIVVVSFTTQGMGLFGKLAMTYRYLRAFGKPPASSRRLTVRMLGSMLKSEGCMIEEARLIGVTSKAVFAKATVR